MIGGFVSLFLRESNNIGRRHFNHVAW